VIEFSGAAIIGVRAITTDLNTPGGTTENAGLESDGPDCTGWDCKNEGLCAIVHPASNELYTYKQSMLKTPKLISGTKIGHGRSQCEQH